MSRTPSLVATRAELADLLAEARGSDRRITLVPTMGALHVGHASLMRRAREAAGNGPVVVSVFVNPLQFGPSEDLDRYPRTLEADLALCAQEGVDVVFAPSVAEVYPGSDTRLVEPRVSVDPGPLGDVLEGKTRPGHFRGVLTVVAKLLGLVAPQVAVFGEKDYQQLTLIRQMVADLCLDVEIVGAQTQRETDGLALSSRNRFLGREERAVASTLSRALRAATENARDPATAEAAAREILDEEPAVELDYLALTAPDLGPLPATPAPGTPGRVLIAAKVGSTRLIDNLPLILGSHAPEPTSHPGGTPTGAHTTQ